MTLQQKAPNVRHPAIKNLKIKKNLNKKTFRGTASSQENAVKGLKILPLTAVLSFNVLIRIVF